MSDTQFYGNKGAPIDQKVKPEDVCRMLSHVRTFVLANAEEADKGNVEIFGDSPNTNASIKVELTSLNVPAVGDAPPTVREIDRYYVVWVGLAHGTELTEDEQSRPDALSPGRTVVVFDIKYQRFLFAYARHLLSEAHAKAAHEGEIAFLSCKKAIGLALVTEFPNLLSTDESERKINIDKLKIKTKEDRLNRNVLKRMIIHLRIVAQEQLDNGKVDATRGIVAPTVLLISGLENLYSNITWKDLGLVAPNKSAKKEATSASSLLESVASANETTTLKKPTKAPVDEEEKPTRRRRASNVKQPADGEEEHSIPAPSARKRTAKVFEVVTEEETNSAQAPAPTKRRRAPKVVEEETNSAQAPAPTKRRRAAKAVEGEAVEGGSFYDRFLALAREAEADRESLKEEVRSTQEALRSTQEALEKLSAAGASSESLAKMKKIAQNFKKKLLAEQTVSTSAKTEAEKFKKANESLEKKLVKAEARAASLKEKLAAQKKFSEEASAERAAENLTHAAEIASLQKKIAESKVKEDDELAEKHEGDDVSDDEEEDDDIEEGDNVSDDEEEDDDVEEGENVSDDEEGEEGDESSSEDEDVEDGEESENDSEDVDENEEINK